VGVYSEIRDKAFVNNHFIAKPLHEKRKNFASGISAPGRNFVFSLKVAF